MELHKAPLVSILIPVFNRENLISQCIESARSQTINDFEIVIVDNASTDSTWAVCKRLASSDERIRLFRNERNIGPVGNWHRCVAEARGKYALFLFSDDLLFQQHLEGLLPLLQDPGIAFAFSAITKGSDPLHAVVGAEWPRNPKVQASDIFIGDLLFGTSDLSTSPGNAVFRLHDLRKYLPLDIPSLTFKDYQTHGAGVDLTLLLLVARQYPNIGHISKPTAFFRGHADSITVKNSGPYLDKRMQHAKVWYARNFLPTRYTEELLAHAWLYDIVRLGRISRWRAHVETFFNGNTFQSIPAMLRGLGRALLRRAQIAWRL